MSKNGYVTKRTGKWKAERIYRDPQNYTRDNNNGNDNTEFNETVIRNEGKGQKLSFH